MLELPMTEFDWGDLESKTVFSEITGHKRGTNENFLVIEVKKANGSVSDDFDKSKLGAFRRSPFNYNVGLFIKFDVGLGGGKTELGVVLFHSLPSPPSPAK